MSRATPIKARYLVGWLAGSSVAALLLLPLSGIPTVRTFAEPRPMLDGPLVWMTYLTLFAGTTFMWRRRGGELRELFRPLPAEAGCLRLAALAVPLLGFSLASFYALFMPLSYLWPDAIHAWLFDYAPILYDPSRPFRWLPNLVAAGALTVAAPVVEEWFFRGLLLRRLAQKWGVTGGVVASSLAFGLLHPDVVGATVFGVAMCAFYARYQSLWAPVLVHASNNTLVLVLMIAMEHAGLGEEANTLDGLRAAWPMAPIGLLVAAPWIVWYRHAWQPIRTWRLDAMPDRAMMQPPV